MDKATIKKFYKNMTLKPGLKKVNIGDDVWAYGRQHNNHMVIYGPNRKEYHVYNKDFTIDDDYGNNGDVNRHGNVAAESLVKIYILTSILDNSDNWCFDLSIIPEKNKLKVIYNNGTIKNIDFYGEFNDVEISRKYSWSYFKKTIKPVGYRK